MSLLTNAYALLIGVADDELSTVVDASDINNVLIDKSLAAYDPKNVILLTGENATRSGILDAFDRLIEMTDSESSVFLYYSGHGGFQLEKFFIQPHGMHNDMSEEEFVAAWVSADELKDKINSLSTRRLIFFLDCCHAEGMTKDVLNLSENREAKTSLPSKNALRFKNAEGLATKIDNERGIAIISSCRGDQQSYQIPGDRNSLFTKCLLQALTGNHKAHFEEPYIRISEISGYLQRKVPEEALEWDARQNPYVNLQQYDDFILSVVPEEKRNVMPVADPGGIDTEVPTAKEVVTTFREQEGATNLLLFIHGFSGEASDTFGNIPNFLAKDQRMDGWDMKPLGYSQNVNPELGKDIWAAVSDISKIADYLATSIKYKFDRYDRVAIVAHSLGGLVAQKALTELDPTFRNKISHLILLASPNNGIQPDVLQKDWNDKYKELSRDGEFMTALRNDWKNAFSEGYPFKLKTAAAIDDQYVDVKSCFEGFDDAHCVVVDGNHLSMVKPESEENDCFNLIINTLTGTEFLNEFTDHREINLLLGRYEVVKKELLPQHKELDPNGLKQLIFSLEGLDEHDLVLEILSKHPLANENTDLMGLLAGRYKRMYLNSYNASAGKSAMEYYTKGLELSVEANNQGQIYYHAINLAFLSVVMDSNESAMNDYAGLAVEKAEAARDSLWKFATLGEAFMYLGDMEKSKEYYSKAADLAEIREKLSMYTNANAGYTALTGISKADDDFLLFLKNKFLT